MQFNMPQFDCVLVPINPLLHMHNSLYGVFSLSLLCNEWFYNEIIKNGIILLRSSRTSLSMNLAHKISNWYSCILYQKRIIMGGLTANREEWK